MSDDRRKNETKTVYANTHPMLTRAVVKRCYSDSQDAQVAVTRVVQSEMDNSENEAAFDRYAKLNNIIERTYHCVVDKKKKKLLHNTRKAHPQADWEDVDTYKYLDYPESGISPQQHAPQAAAGPPGAAAAPAGGVPLLVPAVAAPIPPAALPGLVPVAAATFPAHIADFAPPTEWQVLSPLPPDNPNDSFGDKFIDSNKPESDDEQAAGVGEDRFWLESESAQDHNTARL